MKRLLGGINMAKELDNEFLLRENYMRKEFFEEAVRDKEKEFKRKYPNAGIIKKRNKHGCRLTVIERSV